MDEFSEKLNENIKKTSYHLRKVFYVGKKISALEKNVLEMMYIQVRKINNNYKATNDQFGLEFKKMERKERQEQDEEKEKEEESRLPVFCYLLFFSTMYYLSLSVIYYFRGIHEH